MAMPRDVVVLSDDQFNKLVDLLTPGFECAKQMLADRASYSNNPEPKAEPIADAADAKHPADPPPSTEPAAPASDAPPTAPAA